MGLLKRRVAVFSSISPPTIENTLKTDEPSTAKSIVAIPISRMNFLAFKNVNIVNAGVERIKR
ncbi:MAG: hypothetical protein DRP67_03465 [Candidatus Omnitrophota bacterium]|nr:MAG: hypothetical protein DRP67_03465 [Candidatus Omnitrophota bacterium]